MPGLPVLPHRPFSPTLAPLRHLTALPLLAHSLSSLHRSGQNSSSFRGKAPEGPRHSRAPALPPRALLTSSLSPQPSPPPHHPPLTARPSSSSRSRAHPDSARTRAPSPERSLPEPPAHLPAWPPEGLGPAPAPPVHPQLPLFPLRWWWANKADFLVDATNLCGLCS